jgi:hypothetical protein
LQSKKRHKKRAREDSSEDILWEEFPPCVVFAARALRDVIRSNPTWWATFALASKALWRHLYSSPQDVGKPHTHLRYLCERVVFPAFESQNCYIVVDDGVEAIDDAVLRTDETSQKDGVPSALQRLLGAIGEVMTGHTAIDNSGWRYGRTRCPLVMATVVFDGSPCRGTVLGVAGHNRQIFLRQGCGEEPNSH